ncbi:hypothetical protein K439DRAFT_1393632 [Ramaria rubella]|nr:hypothetical protein K439DRAFT_1393632 [Ramaria rubella]
MSEFANLQELSTLGMMPQIQAAVENPAMLRAIMDGFPSNLGSLGGGRGAPINKLNPTDVLEEIKKVEAAVAREQALGPEPSEPSPRSAFMLYEMEMRRTFEHIHCSLKTDSGQINMKRAYVGTEKHFSNKPMSSLSRISLRSMLVRKIHRGQYLLCRIIIPPTRLIAIEAAIEDPEGDVRLLCLYNFPSMIDAGPEDIDAIFPVGTIIAVREPYLKTSLHGENCFIRVDSPSDTYFPDPGSEMLRGITWRYGSTIPGAPRCPVTASGWKEVGNKHFKASRWLAAAVAYTRGLNLDPSVIVLQANRAEVYLRLQYFSAALSDAETVIGSSHASNEIRYKAVFRAGKASYLQENFEKAIYYFQTALGYNTNDNDAKAWLRRAHARDAERQSGQYDWKKIFLDSQRTHAALDVANYIGPIGVVALPSRGGGRGIIATRNVEIGELLMVAKPFAVAFKEDLVSSEIITTLNMHTKMMDGRCQFTMLHRLIAKIHGNPELHDLIYHLCPQPPYPPLPQSYPPSISNSQILPHPLNSDNDIDIALLESICSNNAFTLEPVCYAEFKATDSNVEMDAEQDLPSAIFLLPSLVNHACLGNATRVFFREVMVVRAARNISEGEEILWPYSWKADENVYTRQKHLDNYGFKCTCLLCEDDRAAGEQACRRREKLVKSMRNLDVSTKGTTLYKRKIIKDLEALAGQVAATYTSDHSTFRPALSLVQHRLSHELEIQAYHNPGLYYRAINEEIKSLEEAGISILDKSTSGRSSSRTSLPIDKDKGLGMPGAGFCALETLMVAASFLSLREDVRAERWLRAAWWMEDVTVGGGRALFEERYKKILEKTGLKILSDKIRK